MSKRETTTIINPKVCIKIKYPTKRCKAAPISQFLCEITCMIRAIKSQRRALLN